MLAGAPAVWQGAAVNDLEAAAREATISFACPRCGTEVDEHLYGPCAACRRELHARFLGEAQDVAAEAYEPKMNVTPNAVALKD